VALWRQPLERFGDLELTRDFAGKDREAVEVKLHYGRAIRQVKLLEIDLPIQISHTISAINDSMAFI
jgi:hypothetical protein